MPPDPAPATPPAPPPNGAPAPAPAATPAATSVPLDRFTTVVRARDEALARAAQFATDLATLKAQVGTFQEQAQASGTELEQLRADLTLSDAGLHSSEARLVARTLHAALPEDGRPALGDWVTGFRADPSASPVALRGYLSPASPLGAEPPPGSATAAGGGAGLPSAAGAKPPPTPEVSPQATLDAARKGFEAAMQTRDPAEMKSARTTLERALAALAQSTPLR